ncbi:hypothetical protein ACROYT_G005368 [Oculina patagonica]
MSQSDGQHLPGWSAFNGKISSASPPVTSIGYCPMINASSTEYSTIYTVMKNAQKVMVSLEQKHSVITFDLAIYSKAKEIQWRMHEEFTNTILRLGDFHVALNYLVVIGKMFDESGLYDIMVESGIYGSNAASVLLQGKSYNRGAGGKSSKLFHFWSNYIDMVMLLLRLIRAEREGLWSLHLNAVAEMTPYFSVMDRVNFARWLPVYIADMRLLPTLASEVHQEVENGNHRVSRSEQPFSQVWTDMAVEQTVNLDSKARGGIIGISRNPSALKRWFLTSHERSAITASTKLMCGIDDSSRIGSHKESGKHRKIRDEIVVQKVVAVIKESMVNPFKLAWGDEEPAPLLNIATSVVMPPQTTDQLLFAKQTGAARVKEFVSKRLDSNATGFWEKISKANVSTFASLSKKVKNRRAEEKEITINGDRGLFGRLLVVARNRHIDLKEVMSYELTNVPYALAHPDGSLRKTTKSVLLAELERVSPGVDRLPTSELEAALIFDGMALLQSLKSAGCTTFGDLALKLFSVVTAALSQEHCSRIDVVFDRNPINKTSLVRFLCETWVKTAKSELKPEKRFLIGGGFRDPSDAVEVVNGTITPLPDLQADHEEADTRILLHAKHASETCGRVIIQSPDTDVAVLSVHFFSTLRLAVSFGSRPDNLGRAVCDALPGLHAITGCDTTSGLASIGKKKALKALRSNTIVSEQLVSLGSTIPPTQKTMESCESFICSLYTCDRKAGTTTDSVRYWMFCQPDIRRVKAFLPAATVCPTTLIGQTTRLMCGKSLCAIIKTSRHQTIMAGQ